MPWRLFFVATSSVCLGVRNRPAHKVCPESQECASLDNDVFKPLQRSDGLCPEHHLQSIVLVNQAQLSRHGGSSSKHTAREPHGPLHCLNCEKNGSTCCYLSTMDRGRTYLCGAPLARSHCCDTSPKTYHKQHADPTEI